MPTIQNISGPYRLSFYSADCHEPPHVHAERDRAQCKFWLRPLRLASNHGFGDAELRRIRDVILRYRLEILETWYAHCGTQED